jgi:hypothetical protein
MRACLTRFVPPPSFLRTSAASSSPHLPACFSRWHPWGSSLQSLSLRREAARLSASVPLWPFPPPSGTRSENRLPSGVLGSRGLLPRGVRYRPALVSRSQGPDALLGFRVSLQGSHPSRRPRLRPGYSLGPFSHSRHQGLKLRPPASPAGPGCSGPVLPVPGGLRRPRSSEDVCWGVHPPCPSHRASSAAPLARNLAVCSALRSTGLGSLPPRGSLRGGFHAATVPGHCRCAHRSALPAAPVTASPAARSARCRRMRVTLRRQPGRSRAAGGCPSEPSSADGLDVPQHIGPHGTFFTS